jgi:hypothetical protein
MMTFADYHEQEQRCSASNSDNNSSSVILNDFNHMDSASKPAEYVTTMEVMADDPCKMARGKASTFFREGLPDRVNEYR